MILFFSEREWETMALTCGLSASEAAEYADAFHEIVAVGVPQFGAAVEREVTAIERDRAAGMAPHPAILRRLDVRRIVYHEVIGFRSLSRLVDHDGPMH